MHDVLSMHHFQTLQDAFHYCFDFEGGEFMCGFDFVTQLSSLEQLQAHVD
jgi:hypothetical protein